MYKLGSYTSVAIIEDQMLNGTIGNFAFDFLKTPQTLLKLNSYMYSSSKTF